MLDINSSMWPVFTRMSAVPENQNNNDKTNETVLKVRVIST